MSASKRAHADVIDLDDEVVDLSADASPPRQMPRMPAPQPLDASSAPSHPCLIAGGFPLALAGAQVTHPCAPTGVLALQMVPPPGAGADPSVAVLAAGVPIGHLRRVASARLSRALALDPSAHMQVRVHSWPPGQRPVVWIEARAREGMAEEARECLLEAAKCAVVTPASIALAHSGLTRAAPGTWLQQPRGSDTAEWARVHLLSSVDAQDHPFVWLDGGGTLAEAARGVGDGCTKWMVFADEAELDELWVLAAAALARGELGHALKAVPAGQQPAARARPLIVYVRDFDERAECERVGLALAAALELPPRGVIACKPDVFTHDGDCCRFKSIGTLRLASRAFVWKTEAVEYARELRAMALSRWED